jgi:hypothetical protein
LAMATSSLLSSCWALSTARSGLGELGASSTYRRWLPLAWCRHGRAGTASPCHGGISWALCKCPFPSPSPLHLSVTSWSSLPSWSLLHALLELASCPPGALLHALLELCSVLAMPTLSWHWLCSPGACTGHAHLELVLAQFFYLLLYWGSSPSCTGDVRFSGPWCVLFKLYDLTVKLDHACLAATVSFSYSFS